MGLYFANLDCFVSENVFGEKREDGAPLGSA